ncbi:MAG: hypothetical protein HY565_01235 [Candidatus Kerfeldbacteria bacterium]|nr:hypothetical protein [Candidatus Kerfeldbacteria bacterium]
MGTSLGIALIALDEPSSAWPLLAGAATLGSAGFAMRSAPIQLLGALILCAYYDIEFIDGDQVSAVFAILNLIFGILAVRAILANRQRVTTGSYQTPN